MIVYDVHFNINSLRKVETVHVRDGPADVGPVCINAEYLDAAGHSESDMYVL